MALTEGSYRTLLQGIAPVEITLSGDVECGDPLCYNSGWVVADASTAATSDATFVAGHDGSSGDSITAYKSAILGNFTSGTAGGFVYLSDTAGDYTETAGTITMAVGQVLSSTSITVDPSGTSTGGISFNGTFLNDVIDFTGVTIDHTGSGGPCFIRAGAYGTPVTNADEDQSGFIRMYGQTSANGSSYDRGIFVCLKTTGLKGIFPVAGLAEVLAQTGAGPSKVQAAQFICHMNSATAKLATLGGDATAGMYAAWLKVTSNTGSVCSAGSRVASVWLDNQMNGTVSGEEYTIFSTTGGSVPDAWAAFETSSSGWSQFLYFDSTCSAVQPVVTSGCNVSGAGGSEAYLKVLLNATQYGIPLIAI